MTAPTPLGAYTSAEAELAILRAAAIRHLMSTGATHAEAVAAVDEELRHGLSDAQVAAEWFVARWSVVRDELAAYVREVMWPAFVRASAALRPLAEYLEQHPPAPGHPVPADDRWAALLERKRAGDGSGPPAPRMDGRRAA